VLVRGDDGVFDVRANRATLFSKSKIGRFPTAAEVLAALRQAG
jgi:hypothetical protein